MQNSQRKTSSPHTIPSIPLLSPSCNILLKTHKEKDNYNQRCYFEKISNAPVLASKEPWTSLNSLSRSKPCSYPPQFISPANDHQYWIPQLCFQKLSISQYFSQHTRHPGSTQIKLGNSYFFEGAQEGKIERIKLSMCTSISQKITAVSVLLVWSLRIKYLEDSSREAKISNSWRPKSVELVIMLVLWF